MSLQTDFFTVTNRPLHLYISTSLHLTTRPPPPPPPLLPSPILRSVAIVVSFDPDKLHPSLSRPSRYSVHNVFLTSSTVSVRRVLFKTLMRFLQRLSDTKPPLPPSETHVILYDCMIV